MGRQLRRVRERGQQLRGHDHVFGARPSGKPALDRDAMVEVRFRQRQLDRADALFKLTGDYAFGESFLETDEIVGLIEPDLAGGGERPDACDVRVASAMVAGSGRLIRLRRRRGALGYW